MYHFHETSRRAIAAGISIYALSVSQSAIAQSACGAGSTAEVCRINNTQSIGSVTGSSIVTIVINSGTITGAPAIDQGASIGLGVLNEAGGVIEGGVWGRDFLTFAVTNAGVIDGNVTLDDTPFATPFTNALNFYISEDGGLLDGDLQLGASGYSTANFIQRGATPGVTGTISAGDGMDIYTISYNAPQSVALGNHAMPSTFEIEGYEAVGSGTTLTLTGTGTTIDLAGNGRIINEAEINLLDASALYGGFPVVPAAIYYHTAQISAVPIPGTTPGDAGSYYTFNYGDALAGFTNNGVINGDIRLFTASFTNNDEINLASSGTGTAIFTATDQDFAFTNTGDIVMIADGARASYAASEAQFLEGIDHAVSLHTAMDASIPKGVTIENTAAGLVSGGLAFTGVASQFTFNNAGMISIGDNPFGIDRAVDLNLGGFPLALNPAFLEDAVADSVIITNSGTLDGGMEGDFSTRSLSFTNTATGHINSDTTDPYAAAVELSTDDWPNPGGSEDVNDSDTFSFLNDGVIAGTVGLDANATLVGFTNNGSITQTLRPGNAIYVDPDAEDAVAIVQETTLGATATFVNAGLISNADYGGGAVHIALEAGSISSGIPEAANANAVVTVTNSGTIRASGGSYITTGYDGIPLDQVKVDFANALDITTDAEGASSVTITNQLGGLIDARGEYHVGQPGGPLSVAGQPADVSSMAVSVVADQVTIINAGTILGSVSGSIASGLQTAEGTTIVPVVHDNRDFEGMLGTAIDTFGGTDDITNTATGVIEGGVALRSGDDTFRNYGRFTGNLYLGAGDDTFIQGVGAIFAGIADGGAGTDTFILDLTGGGTIDGSIYDQLVNFETLTTTGSGAVDIDGTDGSDNLGNEGTLDGNIALGAGNDTFTQSGTVNGNVDLGEGDDSLLNTGTINGEVDLGSGDNSFDNSVGGTINGNVVSGAGNDRLTNEGAIMGDIYLDGADGEGPATAQAALSLMTVQAEAAIEPTGGNDVLINGGTVDGDIFAGGGGDQLTNSGTITGLIDLGAGDDILVLAGDWMIGGEVNGGAGTDQVRVAFASVPAGEAAPILDLAGFSQVEQLTVNGGDGAVGGAASFDLIDIQSGNLAIAAGAEIRSDVEVADGSTFANAGALTGNVTFGGANNSFMQTGAITGDVRTGAGNDQITNRGAITGLIDLGDGNDTLLLTGDWAIGGEVNGGGGIDKVQATFADASSDMDLPILDLSGFQQVEQFQVNGGIGKVGGQASFDRIDIVAGRLIGASGSVITANVDVSSGATFGSAGTVIGDIAVASGGTLSPGASPAIMTVVGDISLASGSTTTFEFVPSPGQSDQLLIDGKLTIAPDAVLNLTGDRPLTPGIVHDMIIADSIDGEFTVGAWDRTAVQGFLRYVDGASDDRLQLMGTFLANDGASPQAVAAIDYVNALLVSSEADAALLEAVPSLLAANGYANGAAFALLTPEPYAAASQLGVENGLSMTRLFRSGVATPPLSEPQIFAFGGTLGNWRPVRGNDAMGTSRAKNEGYGLAGGLGYGSESASVAAFAGYLDSEQRIRGLGSKTDADGLVAGITGNFAAGGFSLSGLLAYDWGKAETRRVVPGSVNVASEKYDLHSLVLDATAGYAVVLSGGWVIEPEVGVTHVSTRRGSATETGSPAFALEVEKNRLNATFVDGSVTLRGGQSGAAMFRPWLQLGVRHQMEGTLPQAAAALAGMDSSFTVPGAARKETVFTTGAGFSAQVSPYFSLMAGYQGEFGGGTGSQLNLGVNLAF